MTKLAAILFPDPRRLPPRLAALATARLGAYTGEPLVLLGHRKRSGICQVPLPRCRAPRDADHDH